MKPILGFLSSILSLRQIERKTVAILQYIIAKLRGVRWEGQRQAAAARGRGESRYRFPSQVRGHRAGAIGA